MWNSGERRCETESFIRTTRGAQHLVFARPPTPPSSPRQVMAAPVFSLPPVPVKKISTTKETVCTFGGYYCPKRLDTGATSAVVRIHASKSRQSSLYKSYPPDHFPWPQHLPFGHRVP